MGSGANGAQLRRRGLRAMDPGLAIRALGQALDGDEGLVTVADVDWARFAPAFTVRRSSPLLADLPEAARALAGTDTAVGGGDAGTALGRRLASLPEAEHGPMLTGLVLAQAA